MSATIAKTSRGFCVCGQQIEPGEMFTTRNRVDTHVGCESKARASEDVPALFTLTATTAPIPSCERRADPKRERRQQTFVPAYLDGPAADSSDAHRVMGQRQRAFELMKGGGWFTLKEIAERIGCLETSAASRVRDFRKPQYGGHRVDPRWSPTTPGVHEYRLIVNNANGARDAAA